MSWGRRGISRIDLYSQVSDEGQKGGATSASHSTAKMPLGRSLMERRRRGSRLDAEAALFSSRKGGEGKSISRITAAHLFADAAERGSLLGGVSTHSMRKCVVAEVYRRACGLTRASSKSFRICCNFCWASCLSRTLREIRRGRSPSHLIWAYQNGERSILKMLACDNFIGTDGIEAEPCRIHSRKRKEGGLCGVHFGAEGLPPDSELQGDFCIAVEDHDSAETATTRRLPKEKGGAFLGLVKVASTISARGTRTFGFLIAWRFPNRMARWSPSRKTS